MKIIFIFSIVLLVLSLTGCQSKDIEGAGVNQEQEIIEEEVIEAGNADRIEEKTTEAGNVDRIERMDSQAASVRESGNQEKIEMDVNDTNLDNHSIDELYQRMIAEQSFDITLDDWGDVQFVSCKPTREISQQEYASFFLIRDEEIVYQFPYRYEDNTMGHPGAFDTVGAVAFRDINGDGKNDISVITYYFSGAGPTGMVPRPDIRIFLAGEKEFYLAEDMMADVEQNILEKDMTIENICNFLK